MIVCDSSEINRSENIEFPQPCPIAAADALLEIGTAIISGLL
jgi:hypothetical protein